MRQILYLTANDRLGVLKSEDALRTWEEKLSIILMDLKAATERAMKTERRETVITVMWIK